MKEYHIFYSPQLLTTHSLPPDEATHALRVLRMTTDDPILVTDGAGTLYHCTITHATRRDLLLSIDHTESWQPYWHQGIHLAVAPTKNIDRMEWLVEKATEIGVDSITLLHTTNSERTSVKPERLERILVSAMKQSHKAILPRLVPMVPLSQYLSQPFEGQRFIAHCHEGAKPHLLPQCSPTIPTQVLIGPEGDFTPEEVHTAIQSGFQPITLGQSRLRTETAALAAVHIMQLVKALPE